MTKGSNSLNSNHERRICVTFRNIDKMLGDMENALHISTSKMAFPQYAQDINPERRAVIEEYIGLIRAHLVRALEKQAIARPQADIPVSRSLHTTLTFVEIAVEELKPQYMRGYGEIPAGAAAKLNDVSGELRDLVRQLNRYLAAGAAQDR